MHSSSVQNPNIKYLLAFQGTKSTSLQDTSIKTLLNSNISLQDLWNFKEFIPNIIKSKSCTTVLERLIYNFHPTILKEVWDCPDELVKEYSDCTDINTLLDSIIFGKSIDILSIPPPILDLLDIRDREICNTPRYKRHFAEKPQMYSGYTFEITEDESGNTLKEEILFDGYNNIDVYCYDQFK